MSSLKYRLPLVIVITSFFVVVLSVGVVAQDTEVPEPYAGLTNPFPWNDTSVQEAGKGIYQRSCIGCHGADGSNISDPDFSAVDYPRDLEERADYMFWILSEGRLVNGMPSYKSSLSEEQRWQILTYMWSLGGISDSEVIVPDESTTTTGSGILVLNTPEIAHAGQQMIITAIVEDSYGIPIKNAPVNFFVKVDFFASGLIEIGESTTDAEGVAFLEYVPRQTGKVEFIARVTVLEYVPSQAGKVEFIARYKSIENTAVVNLQDDGTRFYYPRIGINIPAIGIDRYLGSITQMEPGEMGEAPITVFRLPSGSLAWLSPLLFTCMTIWIVYMYVFYQVFRIAEVGDIGAETRRVPLIGLIVVAALGIILVLMLMTSPLSNPPLS